MNRVSYSQTNVNNPLFDPDEVRKALAILTEPGQVVELRIIDAKTVKENWRPFTASGYYNSIDALVSDLGTITEAPNIYITLQCLNKSLLGRAVNRLRTADEMKKGSTTKDTEVERYRWLLVDADVERPAGISTTDSEHDAALHKVQLIRETLSSEGWPEPVLGDSGNGWHLQYSIDLPVSDKSIVEQALKGLASRFDDEQVHIDQTVFNPARICKLYGTRAGKGDELVGIDGLEDRPHRLSKIVEVPDTITPVSRELLIGLAPVVDAPPVTTTKTKSAFGPVTPAWGMQDFIDRYSIPTIDKVAYNGGYKWRLDECPFCHSTDRGAVLFERSGGELCFNCSHNRCEGKRWEDFRVLYEPDAYAEYKPFKPAASNGNGHKSTDQQSFNRTDLGNAERFATQYSDTVRWCDIWNSWLVYNGRCWEQDRTGLVDRLAKATVRSIYHEAAQELDDAARKSIVKHAVASESSRAVRAMLDRAKSELSAMPDEFNQAIHLLNCKNGTIDLRTGDLLPHNHKDMLTRCLKLDYNPLAACPLWLQFTQSIFNGDTSLIDFIQQALGMSLSGDVSEQCLFICHGAGSNGKTTLLETVRIILAYYGLAANIETFQMRKGDRINNDVAELYGARFVTASENTLGSRLNEAFIKKATGKEPLRARRLHENEFQFMPEFSIWFAVNHKPVVKDTSRGMWRRVHFIPFNVTIEREQIDKHLGDKLLEESEGILAWLVLGCIAWYQQGHLNVPKIVEDATQSYRAEMDTTARFLEEECEFTDGKKTGSGLLLVRYEKWCAQNGERYDAKAIKSSLNERGYYSKRGTGGLWLYEGIELKPMGSTPEPEPPTTSDGSDGSDGKSENFTRSENTNQKSVLLPSLTVTTVTNESLSDETVNSVNSVNSFSDNFTRSENTNQKSATNPSHYETLFENKQPSEDIESKSVDEQIAIVLSQLEIGKVTRGGLVGAGKVVRVSNYSVDLERYGKIQTYRGASILGIIP